MVVYPRWRGELFCATAFCWLSRGLSLAGAGNTLPLSALLARNTVYPRWRGEHRSSHYFPFFFDGLSPAGAGNTSARESFDCPYIGLSPLARGTHQRYRLQLTGEPVYPRWRGEHWQNKHRGTRGAGLSPLARGTLDQAVLFFQRRRFIPAGAGNTPKEIASQLNLPVYPRWRGEHKIHIDKHRVCIGLSPLARGTQIWGAPLMKSKRFIPAGAGNTRQLVKLRQLLPVYPRWRGGTPGVERQMTEKERFYPRWRGEHLTAFDAGEIGGGLSPLARGTPVHIRFLVARSRFIPAGAGNTDQIPVPQSTPSVYPPLARGTQLRRSTQLNKPRFIPAGAGNTDK